MRTFIFAILFAPILAQANSCVDQLRKVDQFLSWVDPVSIKSHAGEIRGFVQVPVDWNHPKKSKKINVFYRLLAAQGSTVADVTKPIVVIMNGGPGYPSSGYCALDVDHSKPLEGKLELLSRSFRVLLVDQRGSEGHTCPLNYSSSSIDAKVIAEFTGSEPVALDHAAVINAVIPKDEKFFAIAQSYGGLVGSRYMLAAARDLQHVRTPAGIAFTSAVLPHSNNLIFGSLRRKAQLDLNRQLAVAFPDIPDRLRALRKKVESVVPGSTYVNLLFFSLGKGEDWEKKLSDRINNLLMASDDEMRNLIANDDSNKPVPLLNYILSPATHQSGLTDRANARKLLQEIPFDDWMIDEYATYIAPIYDSNAMMNQVDANPPQAERWPSVAEVQSAFARTRVIFTGANDDPMMPLTINRPMIQNVAPPSAQIFEINGGHSAIFFEEGYKLLIEQWLGLDVSLWHR